MSKIWGVFIPLLFFLFFPLPVQADDEFSTSYDVSYEVKSDGLTDVTQKITLTNLTSQYYVSNFTLTIGSTQVSDVIASDDGGVMETKADTSSNNKTAINVKFNQQVAGIGKKQTFTLKFKSKDFAQNLGKTWEVNLPRIPSSDNIESYNLILSVPSIFGDPTSISPRPKSESQTFNRLFFHYSKEQLDSGVSVNFGTFQIFDFNLKYNLENNSLFPIITSVTLPPDTNYQDVLISRISPEPLNVTIDEDGNYLAWYKLARGVRQEVTVNGSAKLYIFPKFKGGFPLSEKERYELTKVDQYWEKDNPAILAVLREIFKNGTPKGTRDKAKLIYKYVVETLKYDVGRLDRESIERIGAVTALNNPNTAICMEFTDLFIALARAADIPARELDGFAYTQNPNLRPLSLTRDLLHAWPEYFDESSGWIMVDPTWENTSGGVDYFNKFDLNHLVLAIKGFSSRSPYTSSEVKSTISSTDFTGKPQLDIQIDVPDAVWAGFMHPSSIKITNHGNALQKAANLTINTGGTEILGASAVDLNPIPPFGSTTYQFNLRPSFIWKEFSDVVEVSVAGQKFTKQIQIKPFFMFIPIPYLFAGVTVFIVLIYGVTLAVHFYQKKKS